MQRKTGKNTFESMTKEIKITLIKLYIKSAAWINHQRLTQDIYKQINCSVYILENTNDPLEEKRSYGFYPAMVMNRKVAHR